ncbi:aminoacyl-tRNA hydrolase [Patescibacteria group bacterium]
MKLIVGLGNPGEKFEQTRHNIGWLVLDRLANEFQGQFKKKTSVESELAQIEIDGQRILLCKPQTFMNASGRSVAAIMSRSNISAKDIIIIYDDADLAFGQIKFKTSGSSAGHNGMQSILDHLKTTTEIKRVRIGIGRPPHPDQPLEDWVLQKWTDSENKALPEIIDQALKTAKDNL